MGTRADFYVGNGNTAEWLGSIAWDGNPGGVDEKPFILKAKTEANYRKRVADYLSSRDDATLPSDGWPWPWDDSNTTDYAYYFDAKTKKVYGSNFGEKFFSCHPLREPDPDKVKDRGHRQEWPNMKNCQNVTFGERSGIIVVRNQ